MTKFWFKFRFKDWIASDKVNLLGWEEKGFYADMLFRMQTLNIPYRFTVSGLNLSQKEIIRWLNWPYKSGLTRFNKLSKLGLIKYDTEGKFYYQPNIKKDGEISSAKQKGGIVRGEQISENAKHNAEQDAKHCRQHFPYSDSDSKYKYNNEDKIINSIGEFYEKNIGMLTQYSCEMLKDLECQHGEENVIKAMKVAVANAVPKISYIKGVLVSEGAENYTWKKRQSLDNPILEKLPLAIRKQVDKKIDEFIANTGQQPKEANIKLIIESITHEKVK